MRDRQLVMVPLVVGLVFWLAGCNRPSTPPMVDTVAAPDPPSLSDARAFYAAQPRYLQPIPHQKTPEGLANIRAETCGVCHREIYEEWQISTHARAWEDDLQFQAELHKEDPAVKDVRWMCVNCHTPLENQLPKLVGALQDGRVEKPIYVDNPHFDETLQLEAITCATCHVRDGYILGPYGDTTAPHPVKKGAVLLTEAVCTQCHQAQAEFQSISLACVFNTGKEWAGSTYGKEGKTCQQCHMPEIERPVSNLGTPPRKTRRHWFGGSLIPKKPEFADEVAALQAHYPDGLTVAWSAVPQTLPVGETSTLTLRYTNAEAGHRLPTGDPERFILIELKATDAAGATLATASQRLGTEYQWWPEVKKLSDNRLAPQESRDLQLSVKPAAPGPITISVEASKWRLSQENLAYHKLEGRYPAGRVFVEETITIEAQ